MSLANWRERPYSTWSFQHVSEIVPSAIICADPPLRDVQPHAQLEDREITIDGSTTSLCGFLAHSETDAFAVSFPGTPLALWTSRTVDLRLPHLIFSVSKSVTGILSGILADLGELDTSKPVSHYLPQMDGCGYGDCPLQHLLDMRVSLNFKEDYLDNSGGYARYRRSTAWNPPVPGVEQEGMVEFLATIAKGEGPHGGKFHYLSPNADLAATIVEMAAGTSYAQAMSDLLWRPMGAEADAQITVDFRGAPRGSGGISATLGDLSRLGRLLLDGGASDGRQIVPLPWLDKLEAGGDRDAWRDGDFAAFIPGGSYRDFWYRSAGKAFFGIGIHGQWLYCDPENGMVAVRLASQKLPQNDRLDAQVLAMLRQLTP
ncbi:MAG: serine hydrolase [Nitratireductor sp.]|nr:serine hydrolase [Nitratireductor sp.]